MTLPPVTLPHGAVRPLRVLVVDDEPLNLQVFDFNFGGEFPLLFANHAEEALSILREVPVAVVIADHRMPGMQGLDLLAWVATHRPETVRVLLTAHTDIPLLLDAVNRGILFRYVPKPWDAVSMRQDIVLALQRHDLQAENQRLAAGARAQAHGPDTIAAAVAADLEVLSFALDSGRTSEVQRSLRVLAGDARRAAEKRMSTPVSLVPSQIAAAAVAMVTDQAKGAGVRISTGVAEQLPPVSGSAEPVVEALAALLRNAVDAEAASGTPGAVELEARVAPGDRVAFEVRDRGPGFPEAAVARATRAWFSTRGRPGLGLAVARAIAEAHGGRLAITSPPGGGATAIFELPLWRG